MSKDEGKRRPKRPRGPALRRTVKLSDGSTRQMHIYGCLDDDRDAAVRRYARDPEALYNEGYDAGYASGRQAMVEDLIAEAANQKLKETP